MPRRRGNLAAVPDRPNRVVLYVRVSALMGRGGDDFHSPDVQTAAMRRATMGMQEVAVIDDDIDVSGTHFSRNGIERVRQLARAGQIDAVAVYDVSRFGRDVLESLLVLRELSQHGVRIISACEQIDTSTPSGEWMLTNLLAIAQMRAKEIGRGWSGAIALRAESGKHHGRPLGYVKDAKRLVPDPVLGPAMTEVFRRYATDEPIGEVTRYLAALRGIAMHTANVKKLLRNPVYLGQVVAGDQVLPGLHQPLVDEVTWQRVQNRLAAEAGTPPRHLAPSWSLVGLCECPAGHKLQRQGDRLICGQRSGNVKGSACAGVGAPILARVEGEVLRQAASYASRLRTDHNARATRIARITADRADRAGLEREAKRARAGMVRLAKDRALDGLPDDVYKQAMAELREVEQAASAQLARLGPGDSSPDPEVAARGVDALLGLWSNPEATHADRNKALRSIVARVVVRQAARWREPEADRVDVQFRW